MIRLFLLGIGKISHGDSLAQGRIHSSELQQIRRSTAVLIHLVPTSRA